MSPGQHADILLAHKALGRVLADTPTPVAVPVVGPLALPVPPELEPTAAEIADARALIAVSDPGYPAVALARDLLTLASGSPVRRMHVAMARAVIAGQVPA